MQSANSHQPGGELMDMNIEKIIPNSKQPRTKFIGIDKLAESILKNGLLEPVMVRPVQNGMFELIHGERRWRACKQAGMNDIHAIVREVSDKEAFELAIIENVQRENLTPIEEAESYRRLNDDGYSHEEIAKLIGRGRSYVTQKLRLLAMPEHIQFFVQQGLLTENHVRQLAKLKGIYGESLMVPLDNRCDKEWFIKADKEFDGYWTAILLSFMRPEEHTLMMDLKTHEPIFSACQVFLESVSKHNFIIPQWELASFWWACMAVHYEMPVSTLNMVIDNYKERYESGLLWQAGISEESRLKEPAKDDSLWKKSLWAGFYGDMSRSNSLHIEPDIERLKRRIVSDVGFVFPTNFQPWAVGSEKLRADYDKSRKEKAANPGRHDGF